MEIILICRICGRDYPETESVPRFPDLCEGCGRRSTRFMMAAYILSKGRPGEKVSLEEISTFLEGKTDEELMFLGKEVKRIKNLIK